MTYEFSYQWGGSVTAVLERVTTEGVYLPQLGNAAARGGITFRILIQKPENIARPVDCNLRCRNSLQGEQVVVTFSGFQEPAPIELILADVQKQFSARLSELYKLSRDIALLRAGGLEK
jgi:hypothetical protein